MTKPIMSPEIKEHCRQAILFLAKHGAPLGDDYDALDMRIGIASMWGVISSKLIETDQDQGGNVYGAVMEYLKQATDEEMLSLRDEFNRQASSGSN